ncbi:unnamed protein product [Caenorhabditis bovis]|uniref:Uncharacterized protein n=1 Tax=Caenorhabditis bovis TaxID=2654633 RepID=A0A8S1F8F2_9PELO|nr:unnamed protein product [Caenorhabditis bovis]
MANDWGENGGNSRGSRSFDNPSQLRSDFTMSGRTVFDDHYSDEDSFFDAMSHKERSASFGGATQYSQQFMHNHLLDFSFNEHNIYNPSLLTINSYNSRRLRKLWEIALKPRAEIEKWVVVIR